MGLEGQTAVIAGFERSRILVVQDVVVDLSTSGERPVTTLESHIPMPFDHMDTQ